jgi:hypothetical protein
LSPMESETSEGIHEGEGVGLRTVRGFREEHDEEADQRKPDEQSDDCSRTAQSGTASVMQPPKPRRDHDEPKRSRPGEAKHGSPLAKEE